MTRQNFNKPAGTQHSPAAYAALDLGTNNCRLLIVDDSFLSDSHHRPPRPLDSFSKIVRLGEGVSASGELNDEAMQRTISALAMCRNKLNKHNPPHVRFVATEACRRAGNGEAFIARIKQELGMDIEIITPEEEARLALLGCCPLFKPDIHHALAFDIGGGSTEVMWADTQQQASTNHLPAEPKINDWISVPFGVMNLSEQFSSASYAELYFEDIVERIQRELEGFEAKHRIANVLNDTTKNLQLISTSGTVTTLTAIHLELSRYNRTKVDGKTLPVSAIRDSITQLLDMRPSERFAHPCIGADRNDYILAGCAIFEAIARTWGFEHITVADRGVREGILVALAMEQHATKSQQTA